MAVGDRTTLNDLFKTIEIALIDIDIPVNAEHDYRDFRAGDVRHSQDEISKSENALGYKPEHRVMDGIRLARPWYIGFIGEVSRDE